MAYKYKALDLPYSEQSTLSDYIENFNTSQRSIDYTALNEYIEDDTVLNQKILQRIINDIDTMQQYWDNDVLQELSDDKDTFQHWIDNFAKTPTVWVNSASHIYSKNDIVTTSDNNGCYYLCLKDCTGSVSLPTIIEGSNEYWAVFYSQGHQGQSVWDLNYRGRFDWNSITYNADDIVYILNPRDASFYVCTSTVSYNTENSPASDTSHWVFLFKVNIPSLMILDEGVTIHRLYPTNLLYPTTSLYPTNTEVISDEYNKFFGVKSTQLDEGVYLADFFDTYNNEQADIQSVTSLTRIGQQDIATWLQNLIDTYNL